MSDKRKIMVCICPNVSSEIGDPLEEKLRDEFPISFVSLQQVQDIFSLLSDPTFQCDYISVDLEQLYCTENVDVFAMLNTLSTLLNCTTVASSDGTLTKRNASIVILVGTKTPAEFIKEIISLPAVSYIGLRTGDGFSDEEVSKSLQAIMQDDTTLPPQVQDILARKRRSNKNNNTINLTPRQRQIFNLIADRGASNKVIAKMLNISESTVKLHMGALLKKYKVRNRTQLAVFAQKEINKQSAAQL